MSTSHDLERAFWTPVIVAQLEEQARIRPALEAAILARYEQAGAPSPKEGAWQSDVRLMEWAAREVRPVADAAIALAEEHTHDTGTFPGGAERGWEPMAWANICGHGTFNRAHAHGDAYWTAVYYVRVDPGEGGELVLHDPRGPALEMHAPSLRFRPSGGEGAIHTAPEPGLLVLFPAWLSHSISPYRGEGLRISVAMNIAARFGPAVRRNRNVRRVR